MSFHSNHHVTCDKQCSHPFSNCSASNHHFAITANVCVRVAPTKCAAQRTAMLKWRTSPVESPIRRSRSFHAETKSNPAYLHRHGGSIFKYFEHKHPDFLTPPKEQVQLNELTELRSPAILRFLFKNPLFPIAKHPKTGKLLGQHFDGETPRHLDCVFLRQFHHCFNKTLSCLCSKIKRMTHRNF